MVRFVISIGGRDQLFETDLPVVTLGRSADNTIPVADPKSSRLHARLERTPEGAWKLVDLESSNGTSVNGVLVNSRLLSDGDVVTIGEFRLTINPPVAAAAPPAPPAPRGPVAHVPAVHHAQRAQVVAVKREQAGVAGFVKVAVIAASLLVGAIVVINKFDLGSGGSAAAAVADAQALADKGDLDLAKQKIDNLLAAPMPISARRKAEELQKNLAAKIASRDEAVTRERNAQLAKENAALREVEHARMFNEATAIADTYVAEERYGDALDEWKRFRLEVTEGEYAQKSETRVREVLARAEAAWSGLQERANRLTALEQFDEAAALVSSSIERFKGTRFHGDAQDKLAAIQRLSGISTAYEGPTRMSAKTEESLLTVSDLVRARRYADALRELDKALGLAAASERASLETRRIDIAAQAALFGKLTAAVNGGFFVKNPIDDGSGMKTHLVRASNEALDMEFKDVEGKGGTTSKKWHQVAASDMLEWFRAIELSIEDRLTLASFCFSNAMAEDGSEILQSVIRADPSRQQAAFQMVARHRGLAVPEGGFVYYERGWYSKAEMAFAKLDVDARRGAGLVAQVDSKKAADGWAAWERLQTDNSVTADFRASVTRMYIKALNSRRTAVMRKLRDSRGAVSVGVLRELKRELNRRRETAIRTIYDKGTYPDENHGKVGQPKVDEVVNAVRDLWENPMAVIAKLSTGLSDLIGASEQTDAWLARLGAPTSEADRAELAAILTQLNDGMSLKNFVEGAERSAFEKYKAVMAYNDSAADFDSSEKECIRVTNEYRRMMGRPALEAIRVLGLAARKHSTEMASKGFFEHQSPTTGGPQDRCSKEGYGGSVGENIAMGMSDGRGAFNAWYNSSGHHRNMLSDMWSQIGVGKTGNHWTENLGRGGSSDMTKANKAALAAKRRGGGAWTGGTEGGGGGDTGGGGGDTGGGGSVAGGSTGGGDSGGC